MNSRGRDNLKETDKFWEEVYSKNKNLRFPEGKLLYRVHTGGYKKPVVLLQSFPKNLFQCKIEKKDREDRVMNHFKGKQFKKDVIIVAVGYYLRYNLSYR